MKVVRVEKKDGRVSLDTDLDYLFSTLRNGSYNLILKRVNEKRTINQNDLMWMWFRCIENDTGTDKNDIYMYYCKKFLCKVIRVGEKVEKVYETSSMLNTAQMSEFMKKIQADAASELGITLPIPEDKYFEAFYQQYNV
ncbi:hypothetical protein [Segatella oris]|uniref:hypothetical protein n=1 Tax=Segatella oris TaxID=28135 RepID=UPI0028ED8A53|nr:hypothetical protein [Segatella oris]